MANKKTDHNSVIDLNQARKNKKGHNDMAKRAEDLVALIKQRQQEGMTEQEKNVLTLEMELKQKRTQLEQDKHKAGLINGALSQPLILRTRMSLAGQEVETVEHFDVNWDYQLDIMNHEDMCDTMAHRLTEQSNPNEKPQLTEAQREAAKYEFSLRFLGREWKPVKTVEDK
jgi:hypothetical protein